MRPTARGAVLVTGATGGIGRAISLRLGQLGYRVLAGARDQDRAAALREHAQRSGVPLRTVILDVTEPTSCQHAVAEALDVGEGRIDALVNNAGMPMAGAVEDVSDADARALLELNLVGPVRLARLALPLMRQQAAGRIVNVSSMASRVAMPFNGWYAASKAALEAVSDAMRMEAARFGVKVVAVEPGNHATSLWDGVFARLDPAGPSPYVDCYRLLARAEPLTRLLPGPEPVACAVGHALTARQPRARYVVGVDAHLGVVMDAVSPRPVADLAKRAVVGLLSRRRVHAVGPGSR